MKISRGSLVAIIAVLAVAAILGSACAAPAPQPPTPPPPPPPNQAPVISKLTAAATELVSGESTVINVVATDPDDDPITISWQASEGTITGTGNQVTWQSPNKSGSFNVGVTVKDNLGAQTTGSVTINVISPTKTITLSPVATETGTVDQKNATDYSRTRAGDDEKNVGYRAFWSFDISSISGKKIKSATLKFTTGQISGSPFSYYPPNGLGGMWLWKDTYGSALPNFGYVGAKLIGVPLLYEPPGTIDVTTQVAIPAEYGMPRFQVEALFNKVSNGNVAVDMIEWTTATLEITYYVK